MKYLVNILHNFIRSQILNKNALHSLVFTNKLINLHLTTVTPAGLQSTAYDDKDFSRIVHMQYLSLPEITTYALKRIKCTKTHWMLRPKMLVNDQEHDSHKFILDYLIV